MTAERFEKRNKRKAKTKYVTPPEIIPITNLARQIASRNRIKELLEEGNRDIMRRDGAQSETFDSHWSTDERLDTN